MREMGRERKREMTEDRGGARGKYTMREMEERERKNTMRKREGVREMMREIMREMMREMIR